MHLTQLYRTALGRLRTHVQEIRAANLATNNSPSSTWRQCNNAPPSWPVARRGEATLEQASALARQRLLQVGKPREPGDGAGPGRVLCAAADSRDQRGGGTGESGASFRAAGGPWSRRGPAVVGWSRLDRVSENPAGGRASDGRRRRQGDGEAGVGPGEARKRGGRWGDGRGSSS